MSAGLQDRSEGAERSRRCIVTRAVQPVSRLIRFVIGPDNAVVPDIAAKLPGRGLWLCARRDILRQACAANSFAKALGRNVSLSGDLPDRVERLLTQRCLDLMGLARRSGQAVAGFEKVRGYLRSGKGAVLLSASEAAAGDRGKLAALSPGSAAVDLFDGAELGSVFSRDHVVHAVIGRGGIADRFLANAARLESFRGSPDVGKLN